MKGAHSPCSTIHNFGDYLARGRGTDLRNLMTTPLQGMPDGSRMYAYPGGSMGTRSSLKRRAFFIDEQALRRARKALGAATDAEAVRMSVERVAEMEDFWRFMERTRASVKRGSIEAP